MADPTFDGRLHGLPLAAGLEGGRVHAAFAAVIASGQPVSGARFRAVKPREQVAMAAVSEVGESRLALSQLRSRQRPRIATLGQPEEAAAKKDYVKRLHVRSSKTFPGMIPRNDI